MSKDKESKTEATNTTKTTNDKTEGQDDTKTTGTNKDLMKETSNKLVKSSKEKKSDEKKEEEKKKSVEKTAEKPTTKIENKNEKVEKKDEKVSTPVNAKTLAKEEKKEAKKEEEKKDAKEDEKKDSDAKPSKEATTPAPATNEHEDEEEFEAKEGRIKAAVDFVLKQKQIGIWEIEKVIGAGANGLVARVKHMKTGQKSVMKVALSPSSFRSLIWESEVMGRVRNAGLVGEDRTSHLVRRLGSGETAGFEGGPLPYVVMENLPGNPVSIIGCCAGDELVSKVCEYGLQLLRAVYDLHKCGFLHRDIKPENVGLFNNEILVLYDLGMARSVTDKHGDLREPRTSVGMRGTDEWASLSAELGKEQGMVDDLWGWFYVMVEWMNCMSKSPLAWAAFDDRPPIRHWLKSSLFNARIILKNCPREFFQIHLYLRGLGRCESPNYFYLASLLKQAKKRADDENVNNKENKVENKEDAVVRIVTHLMRQEVLFH